MLNNKKFKFSANVYVDEVKMTYVGLSATSERSTTSVSSEIKIPVLTPMPYLTHYLEISVRIW